MRLTSLVKLARLVANKEATLLEALEHHDKALRHYDSQRAVLADYQARMAAIWQNGAVIPAGDAGRAATFSAQAAAARQHLARVINIEQAKRTVCATELSVLHIRHQALQDRLRTARLAAFNQAEERAERNRTPVRKPDQTGDSLF